jgi:hypothetical protein
MMGFASLYPSYQSTALRDINEAGDRSTSDSLTENKAER